MRHIQIDNYILDEDVYKILLDIKNNLTNGKLREINYTKGNDNIVVTCPVHSGGHEAKAACGIYIGANTKISMGQAHCFACGFSGSFEKFAAACFDCSIDAAKKWLIKHYGKALYDTIDLGEDINLNKKYIKFKLDESELDSYQSYCPYLQFRGISRETCKKFNIKYDSKFRQILFPCYSKDGRLIAILKRSVDTKQFYIPPTDTKPIYGLDAVQKNNIKEVIITEGLFDRLKAEEFGFPAIAMLGQPALDQIKQINTSGIQFVFLAFDNDAAGKSFTKFFHEHLASNIIVFDVKIPHPFKDIGDLDHDTFWKCIREARESG